VTRPDEREAGAPGLLARLLLRLYPRRFRARFGGELWHHHRRLHDERGGGRLAFLARFTLDAVRHGPAARLEDRRARHRRPRRDPDLPPWRIRTLDSLRLDLRIACRSLLRRPGLALLVVVTLAAGIGATVSLFALLEAVVLQPLRFPEPDRLVRLVGTREGAADTGTLAYLDVVDLVERTGVFAAASAYDEWSPNLTSGGRPERLEAALVDVSFFDLLGAEPHRGRFFLPQEEMDGEDAVVVLSAGLWQRRFGGEPGVVGREIELDGRPHRVVGIAPPDFEDPRLSYLRDDGGRPVELWRPLGYGGVAADLLPNRGSSSYTAVARLAPGVEREAAEERLAATMRQLVREHPDTNAGRGVALQPLADHLVSGVRRTLALLTGAVGFVLLIALANVAGLLLGRAAERRQEAAVRSALGAGRGRLVRHLLTEGLVLTAAGGVLGTLLAVNATRLLVRHAGDLLPRAVPLVPQPRVLLVALAATMAGAVVCGLLPALALARRDLRGSLAAARHGADPGRGRLRAGLVIAEVAVSATLLVGAGLLLDSFWRLSRVDPGIATGGVLTAQLALPWSGYPDAATVEAFHVRLLERLEALPEVERAATINILPLSGSFDGNPISAADRPEPQPGKELRAETRTVSPGYFETVGARLVAGRALRPGDRRGAPRVAVVTEALARAVWPGEPAVGRRLRAVDGEVEVVGVVADVKHLRLDELAPPQVYMTRQQTLADWQGRPSTLVLRTAGAPSAALPAVRRAVWSLDDTLPLSHPRTLRELVAGSVSTERLRTLLLAAFAAVAVALTALGLYGVLAYQVLQRRHELAERVALGAARRQVVGLVVGQGLALVGAGLALGLAAAFGLSHLLAGLLYEVAPTEPAAFLAMAALMLLVGLAASWLPARRAAGVDPVTALRGE
jgi:predicted permease